MSDDPQEPSVAKEAAAVPTPKARRFAALWRKLGRRPKTLSQVAAASSADPLAVPRKKIPWLRRKKWRVIALRTLVWGVVALNALVLLVYTGVRLYVKPADISGLIKKLVEEQTGGRLDIGGVQFDVLSGVKLSDVQFYPPAAGDTRGISAGGAVNPVPLANVSALEVRYSVPKMLAGRVNIKALQLVAPEFHVHQIDGIFNFQSILAYRAVHFPAAKPVPAPKTASAGAGESLLPINPALIYLPFELLAQNVGIKSLRFDLIKEDHGRVTQTVATSGLSFDMGVHWFGRTSSVWFNMLSPFEKPLELAVTSANPTHADAPLEQKLLLRTALNLHFELQNLHQISVDFANRIMKLATPFAGYQDVSTFAKIRLGTSDDYRSISFDTFETELPDAVTYELGGAVSVNDATFSEITLKLKQKLNIDLQEAAALARPFLPTLTADGDITAEDLKIEGTIEPAKLAEAAKGVGLPTVSGLVWLEDIAVNYPETGVSMQPISGAVSLAAGPSLSGTGSQVDLSVDVVVPKLEAKHPGPFGMMVAGVENLSAKITARALWPEMIAPILKVNVEAEHVRASGDHIVPTDVPLFVDIDADGRADLARAALNVNVELTDLAEFSATADCQAKCTRFRANMQGRMDALEKLHAIVYPLGAVLGLSDFMPTKLTGGVDFQLGARGRLPEPLATPVPQLLKEADVHFNTQMNLAKLNAKVPFMHVDLKNFEMRLLASGTEAEQKLDVTQKFEALNLLLPQGSTATEKKSNATAAVVLGAATPANAAGIGAPGTVVPSPASTAPNKSDAPDKPPMPIAINRFAFETSVVNTTPGPLDMTTLLSTMATTVDAKLFIGRVSVDGTLPRPVSDFQLSVAANQSHLTNIKLKNMNIRLPDFGTVVDVGVDTTVGKDFLPKRLNLTVATEVNHNGEEKLPAGIKTSGHVGVKLTVSTEDMSAIVIDGETSFDKFNLTKAAMKTVKEKNGEGTEVTNVIVDDEVPPMLVVEDIRGQIPFKQTLHVPSLAGLVAAHSMPKAAATPLNAAENSAGKSAAPAPSPATSLDEIPAVPLHADGDESAEGSVVAALNAATTKFFAKKSGDIDANSNLVALVDYETIRPFYPARRPLSIKRVTAANLELTNMEFDLELRQNWFAVNQFVINFLGGKIQGDFQLAFDTSTLDPKQILRSLRTSVHMTQLDTRKLVERIPNLKGKGSSWNLFSNPYIDGTVHLLFDVLSNDISGGVEITSIGKEQLRMMLDYVDPFEQDPTIGQIRTALKFGDVRLVSIPLKNGEMGLEVDVRLLGAPIPLPKLAHVPINQFIEHFKEQFLAAASVPETDSSNGDKVAPGAAAPIDDKKVPDGTSPAPATAPAGSATGLPKSGQEAKQL